MKNKKKGSGGLFSKPQQPRQFNILKLPVEIRRKIVEEQDYERQYFLNNTLDKNDKKITKISQQIDKYKKALEQKMSLNPLAHSRQEVNKLYIRMYKTRIKKLEKEYLELEREYDKYYNELDLIQTNMRMRAELKPWPYKLSPPLRSNYLTRSSTKKPYNNTRSQSRASQSRTSQSRASQSRSSRSRSIIKK